jgi:hypothetical protein
MRTTVQTIRPVNVEEIPYMVGMGKRMYLESKFSHMDYDEDMLIGFVQEVIKSPYTFFWVIVDQENEVPIGMLFASIQKSFFGKDFVANDLVMMVEKEHRGSCGSALASLIKEYKRWAFRLGAKRVYLGTSTGIDPEATEELYRRVGFSKIGALYEA